MDSDEITSYLRSFGDVVYSKFKGCFTFDRLPQIIESQHFYIINTKDSKECEKKDGNGHWTILFGSDSHQGEKKYAIFFDPFGRICENYNLIKKTLKNHSYMLYNNICLQSIFSNLCGVHCVLVSVFMCHHYTFESILYSVYDLSTQHEMTNDLIALKVFHNLTPADFKN